jgi:TRAP-type C4-dicarboxylate transport system substrate-binding protein
LKIKRLIVTVTIFLALALFPAACGTDTTDPARQQDAGTYEFSLSLHDPLTSNNGRFLQAWADEINAKTNGEVIITLYPSGALATAADVGEMVETGGVDIGWLFTSYYKGQFPLTDVTNIPMAGFGDAEITTQALWDLYEKYPQVRAEWEKYKLLNLYGNPGMLFASNVAPIDSPDDLKGLVIRTPAGPITDYVTQLGASPVVMAPPDLYEALQKNNINSYIFEPAGITNFKLQEVTKYMTDMPMYNGAFGLVMNWDKWNSLPTEYQKVFEETTQRAGSLKAAQDFEKAVEAAKKIIAAAGCKIVTVSDDNKAKFEKAAEKIISAWPSTVKVEGLDAKEFLDDAMAISQKYSK